ncbi:MAG: ABC transporter substrate-binding protein [Gaiellales bacterium]|nr:ABC transporter substrate-binding protein [Gaiellales bacterium]
MRRIAYLLAVLMLLCAVSFLVAACGEETTTTTQAAAPSTTVVTATQLAVTDMAGRTVQIPAEINSIATFGAIGVLNAMVETMGCGDKILNQMSANFTKTDQWKYQYVFAPQIKDGPLFENANREIQIEEVLKAAPDISFCMTKETATLLEGKGLPVVYLEWKDLDDIPTCINLLGEVLGKQDVAADYLKWFDEKVALAEGLAAKILEADRKTVLYGSITSYTQPHIIAEWWIPEAGGISVTKDRPSDAESYEYTAEDLLAWNPDVMVTSSGKMAGEIKADTRLAQITAVVDSAIYKIPTVAHVWGNRTPEQPLTILWLMNKLYPEIMPTEALAKEIGDFYSRFFKTDLTSEQITEIIG